MKTAHDAKRFLAIWVIAAFACVLFTIFGGADSLAGTGMLGDAAEGAKIFKTYCVSCHGEKGDGNGPAGAALNPKPRDFSDKSYMSKISDKDLIKVISEGGAAVGKSPLMVPWNMALKPGQIKDVAAFVRAFVK